MRAIFILFFYVITVACFSCPASAETSNRVVAIVNDEVITLYELKKRIQEMTGQTCDSMKAQDEQKYIETRRKILEALINEKIAQKKVQELGLQATRGEIDAAVENIKKRNNLTQEGLVKQLKAEGITYERFRKRIKEDMEQSRLIDYEVKSKTIIREEDINKYYEEHKEDYAKEGEIHIASIFLAQRNPDDKDEFLELRKKGEEILARLKEGEKFGDLAREFSQGPGADDGGDLGSFKSSQIDQDLLAILEPLPDGGISNLINRGSGIQIIKLIKREKKEVMPIEEVRDKIYQILYQEEISKRYAAWIKELREDCFTKITF